MKYLLLFFAGLLLFAGSTAAKIGVGIGTGKIVVDEKLRPGQIYELPPVSILNTGDEKGKYGVRVTYLQDQEELEPKEEWFLFSPKSFELKPGESQLVEMKLNLPIRMEPGKYFAYVEGYPDAKSEDGTTSIGIAAASKLYFEVEPANIFQGIYYKIITFWQTYQPWTGRISVGLMLLIAFGLFNRFFNININLRPKSTSQEDKPHE